MSSEGVLDDMEYNDDGNSDQGWEQNSD